MENRKENFVISIESELGSKGEKIARELAKAVGVPCYSGEIIQEASKLSGIPEHFLRRYEEKPVRAAYDLMAENYHLTINSTHISPAVAAENIVSYLETVSQEVFRPHPTQAQKRGA